MLDYTPTPNDIAMAKMNWELGRATCDDIEILNFANPQSMLYATSNCDCGSLWDFLNPPWPF